MTSVNDLSIYLFYVHWYYITLQNGNAILKKSDSRLWPCSVSFYQSSIEVSNESYSTVFLLFADTVSIFCQGSLRIIHKLLHFFLGYYVNDRFYCRIGNTSLRDKYNQILHTDYMNCLWDSRTLLVYQLDLTLFNGDITSQKTNNYGILTFDKTLHTAIYPEILLINSSVV